MYLFHFPPFPFPLTTLHFFRVLYLLPRFLNMHAKVFHFISTVHSFFFPALLAFFSSLARVYMKMQNFFIIPLLFVVAAAAAANQLCRQRIL